MFKKMMSLFIAVMLVFSVGTVSVFAKEGNQTPVASETDEPIEPTPLATAPPLPPCGIIGKSGDVNKDYEITMTDVLMMRAYIAHYIELDENALLLGDINSDGVVDMEDVLITQKYIARYPMPIVGEYLYL